MAETVQEPLRDRIGRVLYEEPGAGSNWYSLSEERREPWRKDADRVLELLQCDGIEPDYGTKALLYAQRLALTLWEKHWKGDAPKWKPLPELIGTLTQIDNMTAGLVRAQAENEKRDD